MRFRTMMGGLALGALSVSACADTGAPGEDARGLKVTVAPLQLEGIDYACYDVLVENAGAAYKAVGGNNDVVVKGDPLTTGGNAASGAICSNRYGNDGGGDITYVATCDASATADTVDGGTVQNRVTLWVDGLYRGGVDISTNPNEAWENPCPEGCSVDFNCTENQDTLVEFNFTIMRNANQGFFDVAVNFEDVFCSAKVDCQYSNNQYIRLVHDSEGARTFTTVAAVACTGGDADENDTLDMRTHMYAADLVIDCGVGNVQEFPVNGEGNFYLTTANPVAPVEQVMVFRGLEDLLNGATADEADKMYWNVAVGFLEHDDSLEEAPRIAGGACSLKWKVSVSKGPIEDVFENVNVTYPYIEMNVPLTNPQGNAICTRHPVNGNNGVSIEYTDLEDRGLPADIDWHMYQGVGGAIVEGIAQGT